MKRVLLIIGLVFILFVADGQSLKALLMSQGGRARYIGIGGLCTTTASSVSVLYPPSLNDGDVLILHAMIKSVTTVTTPTGWALIDSKQGTYHTVAAFKKTVSGIQSASETVSFGANTYCAGIMIAFRDVSSTFDESAVYNPSLYVASGSSYSGDVGQLRFEATISNANFTPYSDGIEGWDDIIKLHTADNNGWAYMGIVYYFEQAETAGSNQIPNHNAYHSKILLTFDEN